MQQDILLLISPNILIMSTTATETTIRISDPNRSLKYSNLDANTCMALLVHLSKLEAEPEHKA